MHERVDVVLGDDARDVLAEQLLLAVAGEPFVRRVDRHVRTVEPDDRHADRAVLPHLGEPLPHLVERRQLLAALGDVARVDDGTGHDAALDEPVPGDLHPEPRAVRTADTQLQGRATVAHLVAQHLHEHLERVLAVVRVDDLEDGFERREHVGRVAEHLLEVGGDIRDAPVDGDAEDHVGRVVHDRLQEPLGVPPFTRRPPRREHRREERGDVPHHGDVVGGPLASGARRAGDASELDAVVHEPDREHGRGMAQAEEPELAPCALGEPAGVEHRAVGVAQRGELGDLLDGEPADRSARRRAPPVGVVDAVEVVVEHEHAHRVDAEHAPELGEQTGDGAVERVALEVHHVVRDVAEQLLDAEAAVEAAAGLDPVGDVDERRHDADSGEGLTRHDEPAQPAPARRSDAEHDLALRLSGPQGDDRGLFLRGERRTVLPDRGPGCLEVVRADDLARAHPERPAGRLVRAQDHAPLVLHHDAHGERVEQHAVAVVDHRRRSPHPAHLARARLCRRAARRE
ncbi:MAG: hypothetical protein KatS3mg010_1738 [Acidimicrobiia bacterium]|nr:MAG: hypothetical protein KatS3mg010_1738 [Acidimicrobiia bacterium]